MTLKHSSSTTSTLAGTSSIQGADCISWAPPLMRLPRLASGSCTPNPRKLRKLSNRINCGMVSVAYTATGPIRLGTTCRTRMPKVPTPLARAASMNSRRFSASVWPRTIRAVVSQPTAPMARNRPARLPRPKKAEKMMTTKRYGNEYSTSTNRIISSSVRPPTYPAKEPHAMPTARLTAVASKPMSSEMRTPYSVRTSRSRPSRSVPSQCPVVNCGGEPRCCQSRAS